MKCTKCKSAIQVFILRPRIPILLYIIRSRADIGYFTVVYFPLQVEVTVNDCGWPQGMAYREGDEMKDSSPPEDPKKLFDRLSFPRKKQIPKWTSYASRSVDVITLTYVIC